jgi:drug/metabolite transporter (DMT)-like permease
MLPTSFIGALIALFSAVLFGGGDFYGGLAARRDRPFQVLALSSTIATLLMVALAFLWGEAWPSWPAVFWAALAGISGAIGLVALYRGLSIGKAAIVSPVSGVLAAMLPVGLAGLTSGLPGPLQLAGFAVALPGIWLVSANSTVKYDDKIGPSFGMGILAGFAFGLFFIFLARVPSGDIFGPMAVAKCAAACGSFLLVAVARLKVPDVRKNVPLILAGILDPMANTLYFVALRMTRLDIAAVLSSLYPAVTVLMSRWILKEKIKQGQWVGLILCVVSIGLITAQR